MTPETCATARIESPSARPAPFCDEGWFFEHFRVAFQDVGGVASTGGEQDMDTCWMVMCLNGDLRVSVTGVGQDGDFSVPAGNCLLQYHPGHCRCMRCARQHRVQMLEMVCPAEELYKLIKDTPLGRELETAILQGTPLHTRRPMTPAVHQALASLREIVSTAQAGTAPLVLAKVLEMVWHFTRTGAPDSCCQISDATRRAVAQARSILEDNMTEPPDLEQLSSEVGMSLSKLKQVFPQICGMPPYAYLRLIRMERAMNLLRHHGMSVTEAALEVGYSNLSHFAKTFAQHYGIKPSQVKHES